MGNVHSLSSQAVLGGIVLLSGVAYYLYPPTPTIHAAKPRDSTPQKPNKKGKKKNSKPSTSLQADSLSKDQGTVVVAFPTFLPGQFDAESIASDEPSASQPKKSRKKKGKGKDKQTTAGASSAESSTPVPQSKPKQKRSSEPLTSKSATVKSAPLIDTTTDGSWTRVESHNRKAQQAAGDQLQPSLSVTTETETGESSPVTERTDEDKDVVPPRSSNENRRTLAEKLLPKPRKTAVDDMLETPDYPAISRVMRVQPRPDEKPASGFSWGDYEDVGVDREAAGDNENDGDGEGEGEDNDGWGVVKGRGRSKPNQNSSSQFQSSSQQKPPSSSTSSEQTKRQRQNAAKREAQKAAKASAEADRLATLAKHKRELERTKMLEQFASGGGGKGGKTSGGMKASVDGNGKLVWD
ncbi:hypothetical protein PILCRDRAFT_814293 [Piloderma croceum F 1598]|uniref:Uncharacterized protein n=1 Tax=Piloderma croceum (strain F 1598) TaxID=765440 RepID=A0A0C3G9H5_PILCF|nr:hypothetical protein PILCRDRAFT_814293 [Piloderma croceum F 1598]